LAISKNKVALAALASGLLAAGLPALGQQQQSPESILPPGFSEAPPPAPPPVAPVNAQPVPPKGAPAEPLNGSILGNGSDLLGNEISDQTDQTVDPAALAAAEMPVFARRSLAITGVIGPDHGGVGLLAFGRANGHFIETLMARLDAPIASRWLSIGLRRTLASRLLTPAGVNGADFAAERAWLLVRMGEPVVGRAVAQSVDTANFTPKLYEATMQAALASSDPGALCPVATVARNVSSDRGWVLADAFCAGLSGNPDSGNQKIDAARRSSVASGIDLLLAQKVLGAGVQGRQAITIEWDGVDQLTAWRYGLANATSVAIPDGLFGTVNRRVGLWQAQAPWLIASARAPFGEYAAAQGVFSSAALVDLYSAVDAEDDQNTPAAGVARDLRIAFVDSDETARLDAMRRLWDAPTTRAGRYARLILTARAAAAIPVASGNADADRLVASMLSTGMEGAALRWSGVVGRGSDGWAMLTIANPARPMLDRGDVLAYRGKDVSTRKSALFLAALAGLGRVNAGSIPGLAKTLDVNLSLDNAWTRAIDRAAAANEPGTVMLLAGVGMQTSDWRGVSPAGFYRTILALHRVGLDETARMMAIEALTRL
jgi:hypothetical protein